VRIGNLRASAGTRKEGSGKRTIVIVFYTAAYAVYVHENLDALHGADFNARYADKIKGARKRDERGRFRKGGTAKGGWFKRGPNQQAKFLERPAREKRKEIAMIIYTTAKSYL
jgi:hypothetical protein